MNRIRATVLLTLAVAISSSAQTSHEDDRGGLNNTVTVYTKSRTHIDGGLLELAGIASIPTPRELWQHGHSGPRILRVILPSSKKSFKSRDLLGRTMQDDDKIEIDLVDPTQNNASLGMMTLQRLDNKLDAGILTSGHADLVPGDFSLRPCYEPVCPVCRETPQRPKPKESCVNAKNTILSNLGDGAQPSTVWIFSVDDLKLSWKAKSPDEDGVRQIITAKVSSPVRFDFSLLNGNSAEGVLMKELRLRRSGGGGEALRTEMPRGARFQVCGADETTNKPLCDPLPQCDTFWRRHFNRSCKLYGGTGVLTDYDPKKHKHDH